MENGFQHKYVRTMPDILGYDGFAVSTKYAGLPRIVPLKISAGMINQVMKHG
jgi:hypothetical protein